MDYIPHREDEMVIDEDIFMDSSTIDLSFLSTSPTSDSSSMTTTTTTTTTQSFPLASFYEYRHAGCLCKVKPESFPNLEMQIWEPPNTSRSTEPTESRQSTKLWIIYPLHCKMCTWAESQRIKYTTKARCAQITSLHISDEIKNQLKAYEKGVRDGRIEALSMPLEWSEGNGSEKGGKMARDMASVMKALDLGGVDETDELVVGMERVGLEYDVLEYDLARAFELRDLREHGRRDGVRIQGRVERGRLGRRKF